MHGIYHVLVAAVVAFHVVVSEDAADERRDNADSSFASLPINSKFWNPHLDDKTNMELIGIEYLDDSNKTYVEVPREKLKGEGWRNGAGLAGGSRRNDRVFAWGLLNLLGLPRERPEGEAGTEGVRRRA